MRYEGKEQDGVEFPGLSVDSAHPCSAAAYHKSYIGKNGQALKKVLLVDAQVGVLLTAAADNLMPKTETSRLFLF